MQQVLIHVIPIFFALYMYVSLFHKTRLHWVIRGVLLFLILISCQYPAFCRSFFVGYDDRVGLELRRLTRQQFPVPMGRKGRYFEQLRIPAHDVERLNADRPCRTEQCDTLFHFVVILSLGSCRFTKLVLSFRRSLSERCGARSRDAATRCIFRRPLANARRSDSVFCRCSLRHAQNTIYPSGSTGFPSLHSSRPKSRTSFPSACGSLP